jgi:hypothetical protein
MRARVWALHLICVLNPWPLFLFVRRHSQRALAMAAIAAGALCIMAIAFTAGKRSDTTELLFKTPKLKDLLGTFMKDQGASSKDIREMDSYYKGASMKARTQMLDDIPGEFDPISDADSNYGRVIGIKVASRTNPAIAEDMDVSADKAPVEMLYDVDGPQPTDGSRSSWKQAAKYDQDSRQGSTLAQEILAAEPPH